jgi:hypothetical protein
LLGVLRVVTCIAVAGTAIAFLSLRAARAQITEGLHGFGAELMAWQSARLHSPPRRLSVNGLELGLVTATTTESVRTALDRFHALCRKRGGLSVPAVLRDRLPRGLDGTLRQESDGEGFLACLDSGAPLGLDELTARLEEFSKTGDLNALGELRYVFARRSGDKTTLVVFWSEGSASLFGLFPKTGDAPGRDAEGVPRAPNLRRLLSAAEHGAPYSTAVYVADGQRADALREWYQKALETEGWSLDHRPAGGFVAQKAHRTILIHISTTRSGGTSVSISEL